MLKRVVFLWLAVLVLASSADAKMISGKISSVDPGTRKISLATADPATGQAKHSDVWVNADAGGTLSELKPGDQIWVEADEDPEGNLRATKVAKS